MNVFEQIPDEDSIEFLYNKIDTNTLFNDFANAHFKLVFSESILTIQCKYHNEIEYSKGDFNKPTRTFTEVSVLNIRLQIVDTSISTRFKLWKFVVNPNSGYMYNVYKTDERKNYADLQSAIYSRILKATVDILDERETLIVLHRHFQKFT